MDSRGTGLTLSLGILAAYIGYMIYQFTIGFDTKLDDVQTILINTATDSTNIQIGTMLIVVGLTVHAAGLLNTRGTAPSTSESLGIVCIVAAIVIWIANSTVGLALSEMGEKFIAASSANDASTAGIIGLSDIKHNETLNVSAATGGVGSVVGQIAKIMGCKVVGIAGSLEKKTYLLETLNFDAVINYKTQDVDKTLRDECPEGVDVYFDNVGGIISDMVISQLNVGGRVAVCGQISLYNLSEPELAPRFLSTLIYRNIRIEGFVVSKWNSRYPEGITRMAKWIKEGLIQYEEHVIHGLENAPQGLIDVLSGNNLGKVIIKI